MDAAVLISTLQESLYLVIILVVFFSYATWRGYQALINLILGLYLSFLISSNFPYYQSLTAETGSVGKESALLMVVVFVGFTCLATGLFSELMPPGNNKETWSDLGKNIILAIVASALVMAYSFHVLPITELIDTGTPIQAIFAAPKLFFFWLLLPLLTLWLYHRFIKR